MPRAALHGPAELVEAEEEENLTFIIFRLL
jgi:hypothetical protein